MDKWSANIGKFRQNMLWSFGIIAVLVSLSACCAYVSRGESTIYRGKIAGVAPDTSIKIYTDNLKRGVFQDNGSIRTGWKPVNPDSNGNFTVSGTTPSHDDCESPSHWDNGPLEIFIQGSTINNYHDTLSVQELMELKKMNPDSVGVRLGKSEIGVWEIPTINLETKK